MKELTIEEKSKRYDIALDKIKMLLGTGSSCSREELEYVFPELAENEDERICGKLIAFLKQCEAVYGDGFKQFGLDIDDAIAWLEKQGEQKHQYNSRPRYVGEEELLGTNKQGECPFLKQELIDMGFAFTQDGDLAYPIHKIEKKEFAAWSEEDESHIRYLIECLEHCKKGVSLTMTAPTAQEYIDWLKFLRPQPQWKPSGEQMNGLKEAIEFLGCTKTRRKQLQSLYEQLKKLRKE